jgi:signal transduction histidine kinase
MFFLIIMQYGYALVSSYVWTAPYIIIANTVEDYRNLIEKNNDIIELFYHHGPTNNDSKIIIEADRARLIQVLSNLLDNALKFTKKQDKENRNDLIYITTEKKNIQYESKKKEVVVSIKDTGTGIDKSLLSQRVVVIIYYVI